MNYQELLKDLNLKTSFWDARTFSENWDKSTVLGVLYESVKNGEHYALFVLEKKCTKYIIEASFNIHKGLAYRESMGLPQNEEFKPLMTFYKKIFEKYSTCFIILCGKSPISKRLPTDLFRVLKTFFV